MATTLSTRWALWLGGLGLFLVHTRGAYGQDAAAELLLQEGKKQIAQGNLDAGCASFAKALELHKHPRMRINLADCMEKQGKLASAWAEYIETRRMATKLVEQDPSEAKRISYINEKIKALEPRLSYLLVIAEKKAPGLEIFRDKVPTPEGTKVPVDTGSYTLTAKAPGYVAWSQSIKIQGEGSTQTLNIPPLSPDTASPPATASPSSSSPGQPAASVSEQPAPASSKEIPLVPGTPAGSGRTIAGWTLSGVGLLAGGVGLFFGSKALSSYDEAKKLCLDRKNCSPIAMGKRNDADSQATVANIAVGGGLLLLGAGAYLLLTRGNDATTSGKRQTTPWVTAHGAGVLMQESF